MVLRNNLFTILLISFLSSCKENGFVSPIYKGGTPLAAIRNLPIINEQERAFSLKEDTHIQIYASGEASIDMVSVEPVYLYKPDAIEVYMKQKNGQKLTFNFPLQDSTGSEFTFNTGSVGFAAVYDRKQRRYQAKISMPFSVIGVYEGNASEGILLNVAVADNDDGLKQKAKLAWIGKKDPLLSPEAAYGKLLLCKERKNALLDSVQHLVSYALPVRKGIMEDSLPAVAIDNLIFGQINKAEDFSATMCSAWSKDSLFLYFTILDNKEGKIDPKKIKDLSYFHDWGWIEDEKGKVVWTMTNLQTQHAGGALKNRKVDTAVFLKKGKYRLKYITDESHSWDNWDDDPPDLPFYGIELFFKRHK